MSFFLSFGRARGQFGLERVKTTGRKRFRCKQLYSIGVVMSWLDSPDVVRRFSCTPWNKISGVTKWIRAKREKMPVNDFWCTKWNRDMVTDELTGEFIWNRFRSYIYFLRLRTYSLWKYTQTIDILNFFLFKEKKIDNSVTFVCGCVIEFICYKIMDECSEELCWTEIFLPLFHQ